MISRQVATCYTEIWTLKQSHLNLKWTLSKGELIECGSSITHFHEKLTGIYSRREVKERSWCHLGSENFEKKKNEPRWICFRTLLKKMQRIAWTMASWSQVWWGGIQEICYEKMERCIRTWQGQLQKPISTNSRKENLFTIQLQKQYVHDLFWIHSHIVPDWQEIFLFSTATGRIFYIILSYELQQSMNVVLIFPISVKSKGVLWIGFC